MHSSGPIITTKFLLFSLPYYIRNSVIKYDEECYGNLFVTVVISLHIFSINVLWELEKKLLILTVLNDSPIIAHQLVYCLFFITSGIWTSHLEVFQPFSYFLICLLRTIYWEVLKIKFLVGCSSYILVLSFWILKVSLNTR